MGFRRKLWIEAGGKDKVECHSSMRNEAVPEMQGEVRVANTETGDKVILVGLDGAFGGGSKECRRGDNGSGQGRVQDTNR